MEKTHAAVFDAVWKTGELAISDPQTNRLKTTMPNINDVARFYARIAGVKPEAFLAAANSFSVDAKMRAADATVVGAQALSTPTFLVNGKYRLNAGVGRRLRSGDRAHQVPGRQESAAGPRS